MSNNVKFTDNSLEVSGLLEQQAIAFLYEAGNALRNQVIRNCDEYTDTASTKDKWELHVDESSLTAIVGNPSENAIWEEFGTGEFAANDDGRKTPWYVPVEGYTGNKHPSYNGKVVVVYGKGGKKFFKTNGKKPRYHLTKAFTKVKPKIIRRLKQLMGD